MLRLIGLVVSIGLADSLNPTTIVPAMYLATGERARTRVLEFTLGVFLVYLLGGVLIALGPGQLLLSLLPRPGAHGRHLIEIAVGLAMLGASAGLWRYRKLLAAREVPVAPVRRRSGAVLGATITAFELPTAFPYFAAIAAIVGSGLGAPRQLVLLLLFNICFVLPLAAITVLLWSGGERAQPALDRSRMFLQQRWPTLLSALLLLAGTIVVLLGTSGLTGHGHSHLGRFMRHVHRFLRP